MDDQNADPLGPKLGPVLTWLFRVLLVAALAVLAFTCEGHDLIADTDETQTKPAIQRTFDFSVLTLNVAGLPWPVESGRAEAMGAIGRAIHGLAANGPPVDVVLVQEGFIGETDRIADALAFPYRVTGAGPDLTAAAGGCDTCPADPRTRKWWKGEGLGAFAASGLHIYSRYPVSAVKRMAFGNGACAGYDCLANKGAVLARLAVPGVPQPVDILTTHLNSTNAAGVPKWETHVAHERQVRRLAAFWTDATAQGRPAIIGGDFNIRGSHQRFMPLAKLFGGAAFVKNTCAAVGGATLCDLHVRPDAPWLTSQDLQAYRSGRDVAVTPVTARTVLDDPVNGETLSDHFGFLVRYRLTWVDNGLDHRDDPNTLRADAAP